MAYCELPETEVQAASWAPLEKWKCDPPLPADLSNGHILSFAPGNKYFLNGELVAEDKPRPREASPAPFPRHRGLRRPFAIRDQSAEDEDEKAVFKEGINGDKLLPNGIHSPEGPGSPMTNGHHHHDHDDHRPLSPTSREGDGNRPMVNGIGRRGSVMG